MWLGQQTVSSLERCPLFRVSFIERFHCTYIHTHVHIYTCTHVPTDMRIQTYVHTIGTWTSLNVLLSLTVCIVCVTTQQLH